MPLQDYKEIVAFLANVTTIGQFFSGVFICKNIVKNKSTRNVQVTPFMGGVAMGLLFLRYAYVINDMAMLPVNYFAISLNFLYSLVYFYYTNSKVEMVKQFSKVLLGVLVILVYTFIEDPKYIIYRYGIITTALMLMLVAAPFAQLGEVIKTKSTETLPFPLILSGTVVTFLWFLYGVIIDNGFIQFQNSVAFLMSAVQLSLFLIYPSKSKDTEKTKKKKKQNSKDKTQ